MEAIHSAPGQTMLLSSLLQRVPFADVQALARLNVIRLERDQQQSSELVVTFRSKLTRQVFDEIQHSFSRRKDRWNTSAIAFTLLNLNGFYLLSWLSFFRHRRLKTKLVQTILRLVRTSPLHSIAMLVVSYIIARTVGPILRLEHQTRFLITRGAHNSHFRTWPPFVP